MPANKCSQKQNEPPKYFSGPALLRFRIADPGTKKTICRQSRDIFSRTSIACRISRRVAFACSQ